MKFREMLSKIKRHIENVVITIYFIMSIILLIKSFSSHLNAILNIRICIFLLITSIAAIIVLYLVIVKRKKEFRILQKYFEKCQSIPNIENIIKNSLDGDTIESIKDIVIENIKDMIIYYPKNGYIAPNRPGKRSSYRINFSQMKLNPQFSEWLAKALIIEIRNLLSQYNIEFNNSRVKIGTYTGSNDAITHTLCYLLNKDRFLCGGNQIIPFSANNNNNLNNINRFEPNDILVFIHDVNFGMRSSVQACKVFTDKGITKLHYLVVCNRVKTSEALKTLKAELNIESVNFHHCFNMTTDNKLKELWMSSMNRKTQNNYHP